MKFAFKKLLTAHCLLLTAFALFDPAVCFAKGEIHPHILVREEYNDNIFLDSWNEQGDFITTVAPGISALWKTKHLHLDLDYGFRFRIYGEFDDESETSLKDTQRTLSRATLFPERPFSVVLVDEYSRIAIDPRGPVVAENDFVNKSNRNLFLANPTYRLERKTWSASLGYQYERVSFEEPEGDDSEAHRVTLDLMKRLSSRWQVFLAGSEENRHFDVEQDYRREDLSSGLTWTPSSRLSLTVSGGASWLDYETPEGLSSEERMDEDHRTTTWRAEGRWEIRPQLAATASYGENIQLSASDGLSETRTAEAGLTWRGKVAAELTGHYRDDDYLSIDRSDRAAGLLLGIIFPLGKTFSLTLNADGERLNFDPEDEDAWRYGGGATLSYTGRRLTASVGYTYREEDSDVDVNDYRNSIGFAQVSAKF